MRCYNAAMSQSDEIAKVMDSFGRVIAKFNAWLDRKKATGLPFTPDEEAFVEMAQHKNRELQKRIDALIDREIRRAAEPPAG
jgi:hypothetical protein